MIVMMLIKPSSFLTILLGGGTSQPKTYKIYVYQKHIPLLYPRGKKGSKTYSLLLSKNRSWNLLQLPWSPVWSKWALHSPFFIPSRAFAAGLVWIAVVRDLVGFFDVFQSIWGIFILVQQKMTQNTTETLCLFLKNDRQFHCVGWSITNSYI